ncbi:ABC transporter permease [Flavobacteriaceae bacterium R38]|nr:ABC transporter permease [Flavobacteriaceae bacterium R38]
MIDFGIPLLVAYTLIPIVFILLSKYLFSKTPFASYIFLLLALGIISKTSETKRNDFLKSIFNTRNYLTLRIVENLIWSAPFSIFLIYKKQFLFALALASLSVFTALLNFSITTNFTIPTPFGKKPFEFTVGFRKTFFVYPIAYFLTCMSIMTNNFNLGIFSMILIGLICISYYSKPEHSFFVWNFSLSTKAFLFEKIKTSLKYFTLLSLPITVGLSVFFPEEIIILIGFFVLCNVYLATLVLAKYSAYPHEMNLPQGILIVFSLMFPPILIGIIPYFYSQSVKNLNPLLDDSN